MSHVQFGSTLFAAGALNLDTNSSSGCNQQH